MFESQFLQELDKIQNQLGKISSALYALRTDYLSLNLNHKEAEKAIKEETKKEFDRIKSASIGTNFCEKPLAIDNIDVLIEEMLDNEKIKNCVEIMTGFALNIIIKMSEEERNAIKTNGPKYREAFKSYITTKEFKEYINQCAVKEWNTKSIEQLCKMLKYDESKTAITELCKATISYWDDKKDKIKEIMKIVTDEFVNDIMEEKKPYKYRPSKR